MKVYSGLNDQTIIPIPRSGLVQKYLTFTYMRCFYNKLIKRKGPNPAKVATARCMLTIISRMLKENRPYILYKR